MCLILAYIDFFFSFKNYNNIKNEQVNLLLMPFVGALAAGNCVVLKVNIIVYHIMIYHLFIIFFFDLYINLFNMQPSEVSAYTASVISKYLPQYLDKRAYAFVNGGVAETTVVLGKLK